MQYGGVDHFPKWNSSPAFADAHLRNPICERSSSYIHPITGLPVAGIESHGSDTCPHTPHPPRGSGWLSTVSSSGSLMPHPSPSHLESPPPVLCHTQKLYPENKMHVDPVLLTGWSSVALPIPAIRHIYPMLDRCWANVVDGGPTLVKH